MKTKKNTSLYWKKNLKILGVLLFLWALVSFGFGITMAGTLNEWKIGGFKLGFWFAQQGSIFVFVGLIFWYVRYMNKLDAEFGMEEE